MVKPVPEAGDRVRLTVAEAADHAGTTQRTVRRWIAAGLPAQRMNGRVTVDIADLNRQEAATRRRGGKPRKWLTRESLS